MPRPISALRYSTSRYPGFGLSPTSGYQPPASPPADDGGGPGAGGGGEGELRPPSERDDRSDGDTPSVGAPATMEQAFQTGRFLSSPLGRVVANAAPFPFNLGLSAVGAITDGPLTPSDRRTYNAARTSPDYESGLSPAEADRVIDPYFDMNESDFTPAGGGGGLTERAAGGNLGPVGVTSEAISGPSTTYSGPAQTAPADVRGGEIGDVGGSRVDDSGLSGARDEIGTRDEGGGGRESTPGDIGGSRAGGQDDIGTRDGGTGDTAGGGGSDKIICTELYRQGFMPLEERMWSFRGTMTLCSPTALRGYHYWGIPVVHAIRRGKWRRFWTFVCRSRARELAHQIGLRPKPDYAGKLARLLVEPISFVIGTILNAYDRVPDFGALYTDQYPRI